MHKFSLSLAAAASIALIVPTVSAVPKYYEIDVPAGSVAAHSSEPGLVIETSLTPGLAGTSFTLDDGQSITFSFFDIWTNEGSIQGGEDTLNYAISATLDFVDPLTGATVNGVTFGGRVHSGDVQYGRVEWDGPVTISLAGDRVFQLALSDETFNLGVYGLDEGQSYGATVQATVTQLSSELGSDEGRPAQSVPDGGSTAALLGAALAGMFFVGRKRVA